MARVVESINLIWRRPGCRRGRPTVIGRGLKVKRIVIDYCYEDGSASPGELAERYGATVAQVYAALAYYYQHQAEIDADISEDFRFDELLKSEGSEVAVASRTLIDEPEEASIESLALISRDTNRHYGSPCVDGTAIRVADVVVEWRYGVNEPKLIADKYDLSLDQVYGALAYYHERPTETDAEIEYVSRFDERWKAEGLVPEQTTLLPG